MASPIVKKVLDKLEGERELKILESNNEIKQPKLWARAKELAEERHKVYSPDAHGWAIRWYQQKGGIFECLVTEHHQKDADGNEIPHEEELSELSKRTLGNYVKDASSDAAMTSMTHGNKPLAKDAPKREKKILKRLSGIRKATDKLSKEEVELDERLGGKGYKPYTSMSGQKVSGDWPESDRGEGNQARTRAIERGIKGVKPVEKKSPTYLAHVHNKNKKEVATEAATTRIPAQNGNVYELMYSWRGKTYFCKMFFPQPGKPSKKEVQTALNQVYPSAILRNCYISSVDYGDPYIHVGQGDGFTGKATGY